MGQQTEAKVVTIKWPIINGYTSLVDLKNEGWWRARKLMQENGLRHTTLPVWEVEHDLHPSLTLTIGVAPARVYRVTEKTRQVETTPYKPVTIKKKKEKTPRRNQEQIVELGRQIQLMKSAGLSNVSIAIRLKISTSTLWRACKLLEKEEATTSQPTS